MLLNKQDSLLVLVDVQEKLTPQVLDSDALVARCRWLLELAQQLQVPILVSEQYPQGLGSTVAPLRPYVNNALAKIHFSCMQDPHYPQQLQQYQKSQLVIIGIEAHVCVLQTAMDMRQAGFDVYVVVDAISSRDAMDKKYALKRMQQQGIHVVTSEMVFFEWVNKAGSPEFKALSKAFLQS